MVGVKLVYVNPEVKDAEHIGLEIIASVLKKNKVDCDICYLSNIEKDEASIMTKETTIYGFYLSLDNYDIVCRLAQKIKSMNKDSLIILGGVLASSAAKDILNECEYFDYVILGDGEYTFLNVVNAYPDHKLITDIPGVRGRKTVKVKAADKIDVNKLPFMDRTLLEKNLEIKKYWARIYTNRKCFGRCSFCCVNFETSKSPNSQFSERDLSNVVDEMLYLNDKYGIKCFIFNDASLEDSYLAPREKIMQFCDKIIEKKLKVALYSNFRAETFRKYDVELIEKMKKAGFVQVFLGIESNNECELKMYNKRASLSDNYSALNNLNKHNISVHFGYIMLNAYSTRDTLEKNFDFLEKHNRAMIINYVSRLIPYYKTPIYYRMLKDGLLTEDYNFKNPDNFIFKDQYVSCVDKILNEKVYKSNILFIDDEFTNYEKFLLYLDRIKEGDYSMEIEEMSNLMNEVAKYNIEYFRILYKEKNLEKAYNEFDEYDKNINKCYQKLQKIRILMMKRRRITNLIF